VHGALSKHPFKHVQLPYPGLPRCQPTAARPLWRSSCIEMVPIGIVSSSCKHLAERRQNVDGKMMDSARPAQAATMGVLWALDRGTFRAIVVAATMQKRVQHEAILDKMAIFASLTPENRAAIADCLTPQVGCMASPSRASASYLRRRRDLRRWC